MDRRRFLGTLGAAAIVGRQLGYSQSKRRIARIGLQLYTVRQSMKNDMDSTLAKVAQIGYREVEFAGYFDHSPEQIHAALLRHHLTAPAAHFDDSFLGDKWPEVLAKAKTIGHSFLVCSWVDEKLRNDPSSWGSVAEKFNRAGEAARAHRIQFAYHNHNADFLPVQGKMFYDALLERTERSLVKMEMDLCWAVVGGQDPVAWFKRYPGRFPLVHVKDMKKIPPPEPTDKSSLPLMTEVGTGIIDWKRIFEHADEAGIQHYFVEHDQPADPFQSIRTSFEYLNNLRF